MAILSYTYFKQFLGTAESYQLSTDSRDVRTTCSQISLKVSSPRNKPNAKRRLRGHIPSPNVQVRSHDSPNDERRRKTPEVMRNEQPGSAEDKAGNTSPNTKSDHQGPSHQIQAEEIAKF